MPNSSKITEYAIALAGRSPFLESRKLFPDFLLLGKFLKIAIFLCFFAFAVSAMAEIATVENMNMRVRFTDSGNLTISWWGLPGNSYFVQYTENLTDWHYYPVIWTPAEEDPMEMNAPMNGRLRLFLRLKSSLNPYETDSDGEGMSDAYEVLNGLNPHSADGTLDLDSDGIINREDARPNNPSVGRLSVVITTPADGTNLP